MEKPTNSNSSSATINHKRECIEEETKVNACLNRKDVVIKRYVIIKTKL
jgi:hypothetical protein